MQVQVVGICEIGGFMPVEEVDPNSVYHLGCPAWSIAEWRGHFLPEKTPQSEFLAHYSRVLNTVEGNSFFYALPKLETVHRWAEQAAPGFEFCFKVPKDISHGSRLGSAKAVFEQLLECLRIIADAGKLGPTFLQLHASFGPGRMAELEDFIDHWPDDFPLAVEVRHEAFFAGGLEEAALNERLTAGGVDRVIFDSRALFHAPPSDPVEAKSQGRKPRLPVKWTSTGRRPMLRFVGRNDIDLVDPWQTEATDVVAKWIQEGKHPYVFMHTPDDTLAPDLCRRFHTKLQERIPELGALKFPALANQMEFF